MNDCAVKVIITLVHLLPLFRRTDKVDVGEAVTVGKRIASNVRYAVRDGNAGQTTAFTEGFYPMTTTGTSLIEAGRSAAVTFSSLPVTVPVW